MFSTVHSPAVSVKIVLVKLSFGGLGCTAAPKPSRPRPSKALPQPRALPGALRHRAWQGAEDHHGAPAARAALGLCQRQECVLGLVGGRFLQRHVEQPATERELGGAVTVGEETVVTDAMEAVGQVCSRKRRMNSPAASVMTFALPWWR
jgi:hypothetical protein